MTAVTRVTVVLGRTAEVLEPRSAMVDAEVCELSATLEASCTVARAGAMVVLSVMSFLVASLF